MKRMSFIFESCKEAIRVAFLGVCFIAVGFLIKNESINIFYTFKSTLALVSSEFFLKLGECIVVNLPLIFMLNLDCKKTNSAFPLILALIGYFSFLCATLIFASTNLDSSAYITNSFVTSTFMSTSSTRLPLNTGLFGSLAVAAITRYCFIRSRHNRMTYSNNYFDKDIFGIVLCIILCFVFGIIVSISYPFIFEQLQKIFTYISSDLNDPTRIGIYGVLDRLFSILGMPNIIRDPFYFTSLGGSFQAINGRIISGDVNIWEYVKDISESYSGAGRFITPYYVINIFMIPMVYWGLYSSITNKDEKRKYFVVFFFISILSIICGNPLPAELFLLFSAPIFLIMYLILVGLVFGICSYFNIFLGSCISSYSAWTAMPGNLPDYLINLRNVYHIETIRNIALVGICAGVAVFFVAFIYFRYICMDSARLVNKNGIAHVIVDAIGGKDNLKECTSGLFRIMLVVNDISKMDIDKIKQIKASRLFETKDGLVIDVGSSAYILAKTINDEILNNPTTSPVL